MGDTEGTAWLHADPVFASPRRRRDAQEVSGEFVIEEIIGGTGRGPLDEEGAEFQQSSRGHGENGEEDSDDEVDANWEKEGVEPPDHDATNRAAETIARAHGGEGGEGNTGDSSPETLVVVLIDRRDKGALPSEREDAMVGATGEPPARPRLVVHAATAQAAAATVRASIAGSVVAAAGGLMSAVVASEHVPAALKTPEHAGAGSNGAARSSPERGEAGEGTAALMMSLVRYERGFSRAALGRSLFFRNLLSVRSSAERVEVSVRDASTNVEAMAAVLHFLHHNEVLTGGFDSLQLLAAARLLAVPPVVTHAVKSIAPLLSARNIVRAIRHAHKYTSLELQKVCVWTS
ncbi:hypothetical protein T484DRAFT_1791586 [Baffinella frigidus]|nr:hypothetical protein T484DRAFT_1791586 [Cryptophyta sp. CCMP2293]